MIRLFYRKHEHILWLVLFAAIVAVCGLSVFHHGSNNVVINEVCTSNVACCEDLSGNYPDWIELYNPTAEYIDMSGYIINKSSDLKKEKLEIPAGTVLAPGSFFLIDPGFSFPSGGCSVNLLDGDRHYIDHIDVPKLKYDTTYARVLDGDSKWDIKEPTPAGSNNNATVIPPVIDGGVGVSADPGFYDEEFDLKLISSNWGRKIFYTIDGTDPRKNGTEYNGPIHIYDRSQDENIYSMIRETSKFYMDGSVSLPSYPIDKCTVVKAVSRDLLGRYTDVSTYTYFVGYGRKSAYDDMTVISVAVDPDELYSYDDGIMVLGKLYDEFLAAGSPEEYEAHSANYSARGRASERFSSVEIYNEDHSQVLKTDAGFRVKGLSSREDVQKSFNIFFRQAYGGSGTMSFTTDDTEFRVHSFSIDKCGTDPTKMVDAIMAKCMQDSECATTKRVPCCLFLNGEYWGLYWLTERFDGTYFANTYEVDKEDAVTIDIDELQGDDAWNIENFDRQSLIDYYAGNFIVAHNGDWPPFNIRFWKTLTNEERPYGDAKLRPIIFDMNSKSMVDYDYDPFTYLQEWFYPFREMSGNPEFRQDLVADIDKMRQDGFESAKVSAYIEELYERLLPQMILDKRRFSDCSEEEARASFDADVDVIRTFYANRREYLDKYKENYLAQ